jgi:hypothetical protein
MAGAFPESKLNGTAMPQNSELSTPNDYEFGDLNHDTITNSADIAILAGQRLRYIYDRSRRGYCQRLLI